MKNLISKIQNPDNSLPLDSCYLCEHLLKECICINYQIEDDAMQNNFSAQGEMQFKVGEIITAVPNLEPINGDYVLAKHTTDSWVVLRRYIVKDDRSTLIALNPSYPAIEIIADIEIVGVVKNYSTAILKTGN